MTLAALIRGNRNADSEKPATATPATLATQKAHGGGTVAKVAAVAVAYPLNEETDALTDPTAEARRQKVIAMLSEHAGSRYAVTMGTDADSDAVILTIGVRGKATGELSIPKMSYDAFKLLELIEQHTGGAGWQRRTSGNAPSLNTRRAKLFRFSLEEPRTKPGATMRQC